MTDQAVAGWLLIGIGINAGLFVLRVLVWREHPTPITWANLGAAIWLTGMGLWFSVRKWGRRRT